MSARVVLQSGAVAVAILASACGSSSSPAAPTPVTPTDFAGLWSVQLQVTSADCGRHGSFMIGQSEAIELRLVQNFTTVAGTAIGVDDRTVAVSGDVTAAES